MEIDNIAEMFKSRKVDIIGDYKKSSVIILLCKNEEQKLSVLFEVRARTLSQPGDICLPGGRIEKFESHKDTALREACEELNLNVNDIEYLGEMDYFVSPYGSIIYNHVGMLKKLNITPNKDEVDHVFLVPLEYFYNTIPKCYEVEIEQIHPVNFPFELIVGGKDYKFSNGKSNQYFYNYKGYIIWGFTALIIYNFIKLVGGYKNEG